MMSVDWQQLETSLSICELFNAAVGFLQPPHPTTPQPLLEGYMMETECSLPADKEIHLIDFSSLRYFSFLALLLSQDLGV